MQAIRIENFAFGIWGSKLYDLVKRRYPNMTYEAKGEHIILIRLRLVENRAWGRDDELFWSALKEEGMIQRWEPLEQVPPPAKHNQAVFEDVGYRVGSGERLTPKQQGYLFSQLLNLEARALRAEAEAKSERLTAELAAEHEQRMIERHNLVMSILTLLEEELSIQTSGDLNELMTVEDTVSGRVLARDVPLVDAYRAALRHRLAEKS